jgi:predicted component of type VI protein secretion system
MTTTRISVTLSGREIDELNDKLSEMRHAVNNYLGLITSASELLSQKPEALPRVLIHFFDQPQKIVATIRKFSDEFERTMHIEHNK